MISYDPRAARAAGYLKRRFNDVEIYVEDTAGRNMWNRLIQRLLPSSVRFDSVTMLGGRDAVISACRIDQGNDGRRRLYIVDGDLDYVLGRRKKSLKFLYRLRACTIENILIDERNLVQLAMDSGNFATTAAARQAIDMQSVLLSYERDLRKLLIAYGMAEFLNMQGKLPRETIFLLMERGADGEDRISKSKIYARVRRLFEALRQQFTLGRIGAARQSISARQATLPLSMVVPGKEYLLPLLWQRLRRTCGCKLTSEQFKIHLAKEMVAAVEPFLARRLAKI